jgi:DNA-binding beta-propeller fold protein YncE
VANSESDSVSVIPAGAAGPRRAISLAPYRGGPVGSNPDGLALAPGGRTLYVANSGDNDVDVISRPMPAPQHHVIDPAAYTGEG